MTSEEKVKRNNEKRRKYYSTHKEKENEYAMARYREVKDTDEYKLRKKIYMREYRKVHKAV